MEFYRMHDGIHTVETMSEQPDRNTKLTYPSIPASAGHITDEHTANIDIHKIPMENRIEIIIDNENKYTNEQMYYQTPSDIIQTVHLETKFLLHNYISLVFFYGNIPPSLHSDVQIECIIISLA